MNHRRLLIARLDQRQSYQRFLSFVAFFQGLSPKGEICLSLAAEGLIFYSKEKKSALHKAVLHIPARFFGEYRFSGGHEVPQIDFELCEVDSLVKLMSLFSKRFSQKEGGCPVRHPDA